MTDSDSFGQYRPLLGGENCTGKTQRSHRIVAVSTRPRQEVSYRTGFDCSTIFVSNKLSLLEHHLFFLLYFAPCSSGQRTLLRIEWPLLHFWHKHCECFRSLTTSPMTFQPSRVCCKRVGAPDGSHPFLRTACL